MKHLEPIRICNYGGCSRLTRSTYCSEHTKKVVQDRMKQQDKKRGSAAQRGYGHLWRQVRRLKLAHNPICELCEGWRGLTVHHIVPIEDGGELLDMDNLQTLCRDCHEKIHGRKK